MQKLLDILFNTDRYPTASRKEQAHLLYWMASITFLADAIIVFFVPAAAGSSIFATALQSGSYSGLLTSLALLATVFICGGLVRYGFYNIGAWVLNGMLFFAIASTGVSGLVSDFQFIALAFLVLLAALSLEERGLLIIGTATLLLYLMSFFATPAAEVAIPVTLIGVGAFLAFGAIVYAFIRYARASRSEGRSAESLERFKLADINTRITRQASERASLGDALNIMLALILENYPQFYHAQVFLIDDDGVQARLTASTGEAGQQLLHRGHSLAVGSLSVIGQTTFKGEPVIARSGEQNTIHRPNELLPQTRTEAAYPLRIGNAIIGALDLQSREDLLVSDFDNLTFQSLANSLSLAIDSIRQFESAKARVEENQRLAEQTRTALREVERLNQRLIGRAWSEYLSGKGDRVGLDIDLTRSEIERETNWTQTLIHAAQTGAIVQENNVISLPLRVRGVIVGAMEFELDEGSEFTPADMELVQEVSDRFGLAAENTRLVEESQRIAQRESLINEISSRLQSANNVEATLTEAARSLNETLKTSRVTIRLGIPQDEAQTHTSGNGGRK